ncbi:MAG: S41 family peptidase [Anaerolineales bacterium]
MMNKYHFLNSLLFILALGLAFATGYIAHDLTERYTGEYPLFEEAVNIFEAHALHPLPDPTTFEYGMIRGMLQSYDDPYTIFLEPPQHELQTDQLEGTFGGIGVQIERNEEGVFRLYPFAGGPADEAGVVNGDVLQVVDELIVSPETTQEVIEAALSGKVGASVRIVVSRAEAGELEFNIKRREVAIPSVVYYPLQENTQIGMLQVKLIAETTADELFSAVQNLQKQGVMYFILDLRWNGGGLLDAGIETARLFLREGIILEQQYQGKEVERFSVTAEGKLADIPLVVLVNRYTASSAEIIAGALQANRRAMLIGEPTFGKNSIQQVFELSDGSSLHVTSAHWWFPGLAFPVDGMGLQPDLGEGQSDLEWLKLAINVLLGYK